MSDDHGHERIPTSATSHPDNPVPESPTEKSLLAPTELEIRFPAFSVTSSEETDSIAPSTPASERSDDAHKLSKLDETPTKNAAEVAQLVGSIPGTQRLQAVCCGGGCCQLKKLSALSVSDLGDPVVAPENDAFRSLGINVHGLSTNSVLDDIGEVPPQTVMFEKDIAESPGYTPTDGKLPPKFVTPHPPYEVYSSRIHHARALTQPGAEKRTFHFDLDVTNYPVEGGVDFIVGGAIGICAPNPPEVIEEIFDLLYIPRRLRDKPVTLKTTGGRWPTVWGEEEARTLVTTRRELLTWTVDVQSNPPTKQLLRVMAEYADPDEKKILNYLCSAQGQAAFCDLRTNSHVSLVQLLLAFPTSKPPLPHLLCNLPYLMPRFYSLSNDPHISSRRCKDEVDPRRLIEIAVSVHETKDWRSGIRSGVASGYLERCAEAFIEAERTTPVDEIDIRVPIFRGLMANPLATKYANDGPMLLIGAGVGIAPFRGFVQRRLLSANCANKVWVLQGIRDSLVDELYKGEWGVEEDHVKRVIESRKGTKQYVQDEVRQQADLVWFIINSLDGRVFVCGSSKGMGEGVEEALVDVAMDKGRLRREEAVEFWAKKREAEQYIAETW